MALSSVTIAEAAVGEAQPLVIRFVEQACLDRTGDASCGIDGDW